MSSKPRLRTLVVSLYEERWRYDDKPYRLTDCTEGWAYALKGEFYGSKTIPPATELAKYDLIVGNLDKALISQYARVIERRPAHQKWVSLIEGCGTDFLHPSSDLLYVLNASDLVATINTHTTGYLRSLSKTRTEWVGVPFPIEEIRAFATPVAQRRNEVLICPRKTYHPSVMVAHGLGLPTTLFLSKVSRQFRNIPLFWKHRRYNTDLNLYLWEREPSPVKHNARLEVKLQEIWKIAGEYRLWIDLDPRYTWARWVLEAAALGVPILTTESTAHASLLFPETTVRDVFAVEEAIEIGKRLLADEAFAMRVTQYAGERLEPFSPEACVQRMAAGLGIALPLT